MRKIVMYFILFTSLSTFGYELSIDSIEKTDLDYVYSLENQEFESVLLDCQSFLNGVFFIEAGDIIASFYLDEMSCFYIKNKIEEVIKNNGSPLLGLDFESGDFWISNLKEEEALE